MKKKVWKKFVVWIKNVRKDGWKFNLIVFKLQLNNVGPEPWPNP